MNEMKEVDKLKNKKAESTVKGELQRALQEAPSDSSNLIVFRFDGKSNGFKAPPEFSQKIEQYIDPQEIYVLLKQLNYDKNTQFMYFTYLKRMYIALGVVAIISLLAALVSIPFIVTIYGALAFVVILLVGGLTMLIIVKCSRKYLNSYIVRRKVAIDKVLQNENLKRFKKMGLEWKCGEKGAWVQLTIFLSTEKKIFRPERIKIEIPESYVHNEKPTENQKQKSTAPHSKKGIFKKNSSLIDSQKMAGKNNIEITDAQENGKLTNVLVNQKSEKHLVDNEELDKRETIKNSSDEYEMEQI